MAHPLLSEGRLLARRYRLTVPLGTGGSAVAWRAEDLVFGRTVALKAINDANWRGRLSAEFGAVQGLLHPNLVCALDYETDLEWGAPLEFMVYELVEGETLDAYARGRTWLALKAVVADVLLGLGFLHALGMSHGDVKASNILVRRDGSGVLIDFGCARRFGPVVGSVAGTPGYVPPEVAAGGIVDGRNDLYALGVTVDRLLPSLSGPPSEREQHLLRRLFSSEPAQRPATATEVLELLGIPPAVHLAPAGRSSWLFGRRAEQEGVDAALDAWLDRGGEPLLQLIWGPPGIGKSRLLQHLKWTAQRKARVIEGSRWLPRPVREMIARECGRPIATLEEMLSELDGVALRGRVVFLIDDVHALDAEQRDWFRALVRSAGDHVGVIATSRGKLDAAGSLLLQSELQPLTFDDVAAWCADAGQEANAVQIMERTAGYPGEVEAMLSRRTLELDPNALAELDSEQIRLLARLVARGGHEPTKARVDPMAATQLFALGWIKPHGDGVALLHEGSRRRLEAQLPPAVLAAEHEALARELDDALSAATAGRAPKRRAQRAYHLFEAGQPEAAEQALLDHGSEDRAWLLLSERLSRRSRKNHVLLACARAFQQAGEFEQALSACARALRCGGTAEEKDRARLEGARILLLLGRPARALSALPRRTQSVVAAEADLVRARACIQSGDYQRALSLTEGESDLPPQQILLRREVHGTALVYSGQLHRGRTLLEAVAKELALGERHRDQARVESLVAIAAFRGGDIARAQAGYLRALELAKEHGLTDMLASAALNWATLCQQLGQWGAALDGYERALRLALALGRSSTEQRAAFNLGNLLLQIGAFERAEEQLQRAERCAASDHSTSMGAVVAQVRGELFGLMGRLEEARRAFAVAEKLLRDNTAERESFELKAQRLLFEARVNAKSRTVFELEAALEVAGASTPDLDALVAIALARARLGRGEMDAALAQARRAHAQAQLSDLPQWLAASAALLYEVHERRGERGTGRSHRALAVTIYTKLAATLPDAYADVFWSHPERRGLQEDNVDSVTANVVAGAVDGPLTRDERPRLLSFLAINRRINSQLGVNEVLEAALDAAIELTRAERGFVLLERPGVPVEVKAQRRIPMGPASSERARAQADFSRTIAERVLASELPVVTVDAQNDARFVGGASVAALALKSVACVPFRSQRGIRGALYVDNRLTSGRFSSADADLLLAFGDQVAIALDNAELHAELLAHQRELEATKRQLERLVRSQERSIERLELRLDHQQAALESRFDYSQIKGRGPAMRKVFALLDRVIDADVTVLIGGESGTGKELVARAIHFQSPRKRSPFIAINCGALPEQLLESELFGHKKGAFSGAGADKEGLLVAAGNGTVFLDEIGELSLPLQVKLLRALQEREVLPLGATRPVNIEARILSATHRDLVAEVARGRFREDLYFRLAVIGIELPPLRERLDDLPVLVSALLARIGGTLGRPVPELTRGAMQALSAHRWPGNVRELENVLTKATLLCDGAITADHLQLSPKPSAAVRPQNRSEFERAESDRILEALRATRWNVSRVAKDLGIPRNTLYRKLARYGLERPPTAGES